MYRTALISLLSLFALSACNGEKQETEKAAPSVAFEVCSPMFMGFPYYRELCNTAPVSKCGNLQDHYKHPSPEADGNLDILKVQSALQAANTTWSTCFRIEHKELQQR